MEKARALSRLYSQRNRDKQKNTIENLTQEKFRLGSEKTALEATNRQLQEALKAAKTENQLLRNAGIFAAAQQEQQYQHQRLVQSFLPMRSTPTTATTSLPPLLSSLWNALQHPTVDSLYSAATAGTTHSGLSHLTRGGGGVR